MSRLAILALIALFLLDIYFGLLKGWGYDPLVSMAFHFTGGALTALLLVSFYNSEFKSLPQHLRILTVVSMTLAVGVFWEFAEFLANYFLSQPIYDKWGVWFNFMGDLNDTVSDLLMDALGAAFLALVSLNSFKRFNTKKG